MKKLSDIIPNSMPSNFQSYLKVKKLWRDTAGDTIAFITTPGSIKDGTLNVAVHDQMWVSEIGFMKGEYISRLNAGGLDIKNINFYYKSRKLAPDQIPAPNKKDMTEKEKRLADRLSDTIEHPELRESFRRAMYAYFTIYTIDDYLNC